MRARTGRGNVGRLVAEYAVVWSDSVDPTEVWAGGFSITAEGVRLRGGSGYDWVAHGVRRGDLAAVRRAAAPEQIAGYPSLRLELQTGRAFLIASVMGAGILSELLDALTSLLQAAL